MCKIVNFPDSAARQTKTFAKQNRPTPTKAALSFLDYVGIVADRYYLGKISEEVAHYMIESYLDIFKPGEK